MLLKETVYVPEMAFTLFISASWTNQNSVSPIITVCAQSRTLPGRQWPLFHAPMDYATCLHHAAINHTVSMGNIANIERFNQTLNLSSVNLVPKPK